MITPIQAKEIVKRSEPKRTITEGFELRNHYVFCAVENPNEVDYNDPYFAVHKQTGEITNYVPSMDMVNFVNARNNHRIPI